MAPYHEAVKVAPVRTRTTGSDASDASNLNREGRTVDYEGVVDPTWNIGNVPCGGYVLALVLEACIQHQAGTAHVDPLHISSHFLRPTNPNQGVLVRVRTLKTGKSFTNLTADLVQEGVSKVTAHAIFGVNSPTSEAGQGFVLQPPSRYARRVPLYSHPSQTQKTPMFGAWKDHKLVSWAYDTETLRKNDPGHPIRTSVHSETVGGGGTEWAAWYQFEAPSEKLSNVYVPLLVDMFNNSISLVPREERGRLGNFWAPTMTLAVEFKFPISKLGPEHSQRTAGLYSSGRFINNPQSRHDVYVEVWSAPSSIGNGTVEEGWRDKQICLAIATQMAITVPMEVNLRNGKRKLGSDESKL